jgi:hypothetical protein
MRHLLTIDSRGRSALRPPGLRQAAVNRRQRARVRDSSIVIVASLLWLSGSWLASSFAAWSHTWQRLDCAPRSSPLPKSQTPAPTKGQSWASTPWRRLAPYRPS